MVMSRVFGKKVSHFNHQRKDLWPKSLCQTLAIRPTYLKANTIIETKSSDVTKLNSLKMGFIDAIIFY